MSRGAVPRIQSGSTSSKWLLGASCRLIIIKFKNKSTVIGYTDLIHTISNIKHTFHDTLPLISQLIWQTKLLAKRFFQFLPLKGGKNLEERVFSTRPL